MNVRKTWKLRLSAIVLIALVFFMQMIEIKASENEKFPLAEITDFAYIKDSTGTYMGAKDYAVLGKTTYLLLDKENTLLVFKNHMISEKVCFDSLNIKVHNFAVTDKRDTILVYDHRSCIDVVKNGNIVDYVDAKKIAGFEAVEEFYWEGEELILCVDDFFVKDYMTYIFGLEDDKLFLKDSYLGRRIPGGEIEDTKTFREAVEKSNDELLNTQGYDIVAVPGIRILGELEGGRRAVQMVEIVTDGSREYLLERVRIYNKENKLTEQFILPKQKAWMLTPVKIFDGKLVILLTDEASIQIVQVKDFLSSTIDTTNIIPIEWSEDTAAPQMSESVFAPLTLLTRQSCIDRAYSYYNFNWTCTASNLAALSGWVKPHYVSGAGSYTAMPYCWGGWHTKAQYNAGMTSGGRVGNACGTYVSNTFGHDCSGLVSRAWSLSTKHNTSMIPGISTQKTWGTVGVADAINKNGHVRLFTYKTTAGNVAVYESTTGGNRDRVTTNVYTQATLVAEGYKPYSYNGFAD